MKFTTVSAALLAMAASLVSARSDSSASDLEFRNYLNDYEYLSNRQYDAGISSRDHVDEDLVFRDDIDDGLFSRDDTDEDFLSRDYLDEEAEAFDRRFLGFFEEDEIQLTFRYYKANGSEELQVVPPNTETVKVNDRDQYPSVQRKALLRARRHVNPYLNLTQLTFECPPLESCNTTIAKLATVVIEVFANVTGLPEGGLFSHIGAILNEII